MTIEFAPDTETLELLKGLADPERSKYINDAIKAFGAGRPVGAVATKNASPAEQVAAELTRIFEGNCKTISASEADSADYVCVTEAKSQLRVRCPKGDALDILKSLRQPITETEVWEILSCLG